jgi:hypothetical protein
LNLRHSLAALLVSVAPACFSTPSVDAATKTHASYIGRFSQLAQSRMSGDCSGIAVQLWRLRTPSGQDQVYGYLDVYDGPCRAKALALTEARFEPDSNTLSFVAVNGAAPHERYRFVGHLGKDRLVGRGTFARLDRSEFVDADSAAVEFKRERLPTRQRR